MPNKNSKKSSSNKKYKQSKNKSNNNQQKSNTQNNEIEINLIPKKIRNVKDHFKKNNLLLFISKYGFDASITIDNGLKDLKKKLRWNKDYLKYDVTNQFLDNSYVKRIEELSSSLNGTKFIGKLKTPLSIGLGTISVMDTSITLHYINGFPYIPSFSIKGLTRSYMVEKYYDGDEKKAMDDDGIKIIFGISSNQKENEYMEQIASINNPTEHVGLIIFFDAFPIIETIKIDLDIMNPHYPDYYKGNSYPTDNQNPQPIFFPVIKEGEFEFNLGINPYHGFLKKYQTKDHINTKINNFPTKLDNNSPKAILNITSELLKEALIEEGIGAKTSLSYGMFTIK